MAKKSTKSKKLKRGAIKAMLCEFTAILAPYKYDTKHGSVYPDMTKAVHVKVHLDNTKENPHEACKRQHPNLCKGRHWFRPLTYQMGKRDEVF
jgi:hypothetical protein